MLKGAVLRNDGNFYSRVLRTKIPSSSSKPLRDVPKLPPPQTGPRDFVSREALSEWWKANWSTLVLNFGSVCTLTGFTRSDVLELRCFSVTGSLCNVIYQSTMKPVRMVTVLWSGLFASVNIFNIYRILHERNSSVRLSEDEEEM